MNSLSPSHFEKLYNLLLKYANKHTIKGSDEFNEEYHELLRSAESPEICKAYKATINNLIYDILKHNTQENGYYE